MRWGKIVWATLRILFALFFIGVTILVEIRFGGRNPPASGAAGRFTDAMDATGYLDPLLSITLVAGGIAMLTDRFAPVGLILLAAPIALIAGFHWFLTGDYVWGGIWPLWWAVLAWHYRHVFARLWERRGAGG